MGGTKASPLIGSPAMNVVGRARSTARWPDRCPDGPGLEPEGWRTSHEKVAVVVRSAHRDTRDEVAELDMYRKGKG